MTRPRIAPRLVACPLLVVLLASATRAAELPWLRAEGPKIVDERGKAVVLGGANLGGWLVEETWMMPFQTKPPEGSGLAEVKDHLSLWGAVEKRLGAPEAARVRRAVRDAWISDSDFDRIAKAGMNCVRVPFTFDLLKEPDGYATLDRAIDRAKSRGLYTILDLHGTPGRQSGEHHTGEAGVDRLFKDRAHVVATAALWAEIAARYRDRPEVAAFDLMNEPMGAPDAATLYLVQDQVFRAIRAVDPKHLIVVEDGYKGVETFPRPAVVGWEGVILSSHHYHFDAKSPADQDAKADAFVASVEKVARDRRAPYLVGEFQFEPHGTPATTGRFVKSLESKGLSWTTWTYKTAMTGGGGGMWGWYRAGHPIDPIDPFRDSADAMIRKAEQVTSKKLIEDAALTRAFRDRGSP